jgi:outer membrane lipoprotein
MAGPRHDTVTGARGLPYLVALLLAACAIGPRFETGEIDRGLTPANSISRLPAAEGKQVLWGGVILNTTNLKQRTDVEVLAYPLDGDQKPQRDARELGRFVFQTNDYLEPATYAKDRMVTLVGRLVGSRPGKVGDRDYVYPVVEARQLYLWPRESDYNTGGVNFGIGVGIGF